jgi:hypothetical protein
MSVGLRPRLAAPVGVRCTFSRSLAILFALCALLLPGLPAHAGLFLSVELRESYDDNVIGLTADNRTGTTGPLQGSVSSVGAAAMNGKLGGMPGPGGGGGAGTTTVQQKGDFSTNFFANIGYDRDLGERTTAFLEVSVDHTRFTTYADFDFTIGTASAGATRRLSDIFSLKAAVYGSVKNFANNLRDGTAYGVGIALRERFSPSFWAKQYCDIEQNRADSPSYSYLGSSAGISAGYDITEASTLSAGYTYFLRDYRDVAPAVTVVSQLAFVEWATDLNASWSVALGYDREWADSNIPDTATTNNRYRVGIRYAY